ncbi:MAG: hypothetical protein U1E70_01975 [Acetobacteraceae bacterium]|nr:hypothetical protein [Pseudomonadota bacterium]
MPRPNGCARYAAALALALAAALTLPLSASAAFVMTMKQIGSDVTLSGSGSLDTTGLSFVLSGTDDNEITPNGAIVHAGPDASAVSLFEGLLGPASFGPGDRTDATSGAGAAVGLEGGKVLMVPEAYQPGDLLTTTLTFANATFDSLGVTPGTYVWTWGSELAGTADSFTLQIIPEPASLVAVVLPVGGLMLSRRLRKVRSR